MIEHLNSVRGFLDELSPELGVTEPVSGLIVIHNSWFKLNKSYFCFNCMNENHSWLQTKWVIDDYRNHMNAPEQQAMFQEMGVLVFVLYGCL